MSIQTRLQALETLARPKLARPILCLAPSGPTPEQQAQLDDALSEGKPLRVIRMVSVEANISNNKILN